MSLFQSGEFKSAAGLLLKWKIECDALTDNDWKCIAEVGARMLGYDFFQVVGVPRGGMRLAEFMYKHRNKDSKRVLFVDDVWTTGKSLRGMANVLGFAAQEFDEDLVRTEPRESSIGRLNGDRQVSGFVAFARGPLPRNVKAFMTCTDQ